MQQIREYLTKLLKLITFPVVTEKVNISASSNKHYDINDLSQQPTDVDVLSSDIRVLVQSTIDGQAQYINSEGMVTVGIDEDAGRIIITNHTDRILNCHVYIRLKHKG